MREIFRSTLFFASFIGTERDFIMVCLCGNTKCDCEEECFCIKQYCRCPLCKFLPKMCFKCSLPIDVIPDSACQVCSCGKKAESSSSETVSGSSTAESDESCESKVPLCAYCRLPIFLVAIDDDDEYKVGYCRCLQNEQIQSEHETSTSTSDHRQVSADRQVRKALSRKTRSQQSNWQAKKAKDRSPEASDFTETVGPGTLLSDTSDLHLAEHDSYSACATSVSNMDINSPQRLSSRTDETSAGNLSLLANTSGVSIQCTPEASSSQTSGYKQANIQGKVSPFLSLPDPIPGSSALGIQQYPSPSRIRAQETPEPILPEQASVERIEKMEKWFGTIQDVLNTSGELPDAETAAELDKLDKEERPGVSDSDEFPHCDAIPPPPKREDKDDTEQHTDTDRSTSVSHSRIESDHMESESDF